MLDVGCAELAAFHFDECVFDHSPFLNDAETKFIGFTNCLLQGMNAERIRCAGPAWLNGNRILGSVRMQDSKIDGDLVFTTSVIDAPQAKAAVQLEGAHIANNLDIRGARIIGMLRINTARIDGNFFLNDARLTTPDSLALNASDLVIGGSIIGGNGVQVKGGMLFENSTVAGSVNLNRLEVSRPLDLALDLDHCRFAMGFHCEDARIRGMVRLHHMVAGCQVTLARTRVDEVRKGVDAVHANHLEVDGAAYFNDVSLVGPLALHGAKVTCDLSISGAKISPAGSGAAFWANGAYVGNDFIANNCNMDGAVILHTIKIDGEANFANATIINGTDTALDLRRAVLKGSLIATGSFATTGSVKLTNATVGVDLILTEATLKNPRSIALAASGLHVTGDMIADRCTIEGLVDLASNLLNGNLRFVDAVLSGLSADESSRGTSVDAKGEWRGLALRCTGSRIAGNLDLRSARLKRELMLDSATIGGSVRLTGTHLATEGPYALRAEGLTADTLILKPASQPIHAISLASASIQELVDDVTSWPREAHINISDFQYERLDSDVSVTERLEWLERATPTYAAQPYEKLATCLDLAGQQGDARTVRLASVRRAHRSKNLLIRLWGTLQDAVIGYGYAPIRALAIFGVLLVGAGLWFSFGATACLPTQLGLCPVKADEHPTWDPWLYALDLLIPLVDLGHEKAWDPLGMSKLVAMVLIMSGWVLTTTVIAAASRTLRRT
ncbi:hypothetical protein [Nonomuraea fuscirosea]|uniref:hypothetical protein n=1 Tax=Nonomuraea fuscirosea TaxID=1291556 RepID=UPI00344AA69F